MHDDQTKLYDRFDAIMLLTASKNVLLERLATRTTNPFGKDPVERERILRDLATVEPWLRDVATVVISTDGAGQDVVEPFAANISRSWGP